MNDFETIRGRSPSSSIGPLNEETIALGLDIAGTFEWTPRLHCSSVAAVRGHVYGGGLQLALG
jgi:hypothetical protein